MPQTNCLPSPSMSPSWSVELWAVVFVLQWRGTVASCSPGGRSLVSRHFQFGVSPPPPCRPEQEMTVFPRQSCPDLINIAAAARGSHSAVAGAATAALQGSEAIIGESLLTCPPFPSPPNFILPSPPLPHLPLSIPPPFSRPPLPHPSSSSTSLLIAKNYLMTS